RPGVAVIVIPRHVAADASRHIALRDAVSERDHHDGARTLDVDRVDRRGSHERGTSGRVLRRDGAIRPSVAVGKIVDVARRHRAVDVEGNVQLVAGRDGEGNRVAGHAPLRIAGEARRAVEGDRDGRGHEVALGPGQRDGGGMYGQRAVACPEADPQARAATADGNLRAVSGSRGGAHRRGERLVEARLEYELLRPYGWGVCERDEADEDGCGERAEESNRPSLLHPVPPGRVVWVESGAHV